MSKKSNKKSPKKKVSPKGSSGTKKIVKKTVKKKVAKKPAPKPAKKAKAIKAPAKKIAVKKIKAEKVVAKKVAAPAKIAPKKVAPVVAKAVVKEVEPPVVKKSIFAKPERNFEPKKSRPPRKIKPTGPRNLVPVISRKSVVIDVKTGPEPKGRFEMEYVVHSSAPILFEFLTTPSGLSEWFCDDVNIRNGVYSFKWEENEQIARVVKLIEEKHVRFQWVDKTDNSYFEFRIERDELTNDISLIVVDFAETPEDRASSTLLWNSQIDKLLHVLGSYF
jgi:uncharacterized protein YndB with AHSA1/START domain